MPRGISKIFLILLFFFILFWWGGYKSGEQMWKDWEINGIRVHDVLFPKNPILKFMSKKKNQRIPY